MTSGPFRAGVDAVSAIGANRHLRRIEAAFFGFNVVEYGTWVAILVYANTATGPASVGFVALIQLVPAALYAPIASSLGDRYPRTRVLLGGYALIAASCLAVGAAMMAGAPPGFVYVCAIVAAAFMTMPRPAQAAITPAFAETLEQLTAANGINAIFEGLGVMVGPLAAGILMVLGSPALVFLGGGIVAGGCALLVADLETRPTVIGGEATASAPPAASVESVPGGASPRMLAGVRSIAGDRGQVLVLAILAARFVIIGALDVLLVLVASRAFGSAGAGAGFLVAAVGLGGFLGGALTVVLVGRRQLAAWILAGGLATGAALGVVAVVPAVAAILAVLVAGGIGLACLDVAGRTLLQRIGRRDLLAEVFGLVEGFAMLGLAAGSVGASLLYASFGLPAALAAAALFLPAIAAAAWLGLTPVEATLDLPMEQIAVLRRLPIFALLPAPSLEAAARRLVRVAAPANTRLFSEGERGDRFYVVAGGSVAITQHGVAVRTLGPGASFGEIALLRSVGRTASAVAATDADLWALDRDEFLLAITGSPQAVADAQARAEEMLAADRART